MTEFDWNDKEHVAIRPTAAVAVYENPDGDIVIRQQQTGDYWPSDPFVVIARDRLCDLLSALHVLEGGGVE